APPRAGRRDDRAGQARPAAQGRQGARAGAGARAARAHRVARTQRAPAPSLGGGSFFYTGSLLRKSSPSQVEGSLRTAGHSRLHSHEAAATAARNRRNRTPEGYAVLKLLRFV